MDIEAMKQQVQRRLKENNLTGPPPLPSGFQEYVQVQAGNSRVKRTIIPKFVNNCNTIKVDLRNLNQSIK